MSVAGRVSDAPWGDMTNAQRFALEEAGDAHIATAFNTISFAVSQRVGGDELRRRLKRALASLDEARGILTKLSAE